MKKTKKNNILVISNYAAPYTGNFIESIKEFGKFSEKNGNKVFYWFNEAAKRTKWAKTIPQAGFLDDSFARGVKELIQFVRKNNITIIYTHFCDSKMMMAIQVVKALYPRIKIVEHFHNHFGNSGNLAKKIIKKFIYKADLYIGCSEGVAKSLPYTHNKVFYVNNGLFFPRLDEYEGLNLIPKQDFKILMFGHTYKRKGVDIAIRAIQKLNNPRIKLLISVSVEKDEFESEIRNEFGGIPEFVEILEPRNDIGTYYRNVDLFISPSREEGLCYSPLEAMYCGTPCICSDIDGHARNIPDLLLFKSENVNDLARQIKNVYDGNYEFDASKVRKFLERRYGVERWAKEIIEVFNVYLNQQRD